MALKTEREKINLQVNKLGQVCCNKENLVGSRKTCKQRNDIHCVITKWVTRKSSRKEKLRDSKASTECNFEVGEN